ncbi:NAD(P)H-dependent flavin oxidoreductase [Helicovermis profundi]|uniref:Probable nitronate monooxygenase n=1 Tax=Helicovermis profundi TaxID=3065157 RepID=A0AAU9EB17_9FIRM|nr:nitronate monooxygenase family protein [Clostridia bacterium S502]
MKMPSFKLGHLTVNLPIIQGGMGIGVSLSNLASAVANEGGIGIISGAQIGFREKNFKSNNDEANINALVKEIRNAKKLSPNGIIGVNVLMATNNYADMIKTAVKEKVDLIISGAGLPKDLPELVKGSNTKIAPIVSSKRSIDTIIKLWKKRYDKLPDMVIVEGGKAGGHLGFKAEDLINKTFPSIYQITKEVVESVRKIEEQFNAKIPVISAGGIFSGKDILEAFNAGADGVQMATRFVATNECDAHENFKLAYVNANEDNIDIIKSPVGMPGRAIVNEFTESVKNAREKITSCYRCLKQCNPATTPYCITDALIRSVTGDSKNGLIFAGSNAYKVNSIKSVHEIVEEIKKEYFIALSNK